MCVCMCMCVCVHKGEGRGEGGCHKLSQLLAAMLIACLGGFTNLVTFFVCVFPFFLKEREREHCKQENV